MVSLVGRTDRNSDESHFYRSIEFAEDVGGEGVDSRDAHQKASALRDDFGDPLIWNAGVLPVGSVGEDHGGVDAIEIRLKLFGLRGFFDPAIGSSSPKDLGGLSAQSFDRGPDSGLCVNHHGWLLIPEKRRDDRVVWTDVVRL
jgi:hypothetical protein